MVDEAAPETNQSRAKVFISYSRKDLAFSDRLDAALKARGFEPLIDRTDILAFEEWWKRVEALIGRADTVVFVLSPDAVRAESIARKEVAFAASLNKRFAPIVFRPVQDKDVPEALAKLNFIFFDDLAQFEQSADKLAEALNTDIGWVRQHTDFGEQARRWAQAKGTSGLLLRSPVLEQAERWIASRSPGAPAPTDETQAFIRQSRQGATKRRNVLTGSLAAGLVLALALAGLAYWQRGVAVEQRSIAQQNEAQAKEERDRATRNFRLAQKTAEDLVFNIALGLRNVQGMSAVTVRKILETARETFEQLVQSSPDDLGLQRSRAAMLNQFGNTYVSLGDLEDALTAFRDLLAIMKRLVAADPSNKGWQDDMAVAYKKIGDVLFVQGNLDEALHAFQEALALRERLADQGDLSDAYDSFGKVLAAQGKLDEALKAFQDALAIRQKLTASDSTASTNLPVLYIDIGDTLRAQGRLDETLEAYREGLAISNRLYAADQADTRWQRYLSALYARIGDVLMEQGKLGEALDAYRDGFGIAKRLADTDPSNSIWQSDLSIRYERIGNVLFAQHDLDGALKAYRDALSIVERIASANPSSVLFQSNLSLEYVKIGDVLVMQGNLGDALKAYRECVGITERLVATRPDNTEWQEDLSVSYDKVGEVLGPKLNKCAAVQGQS